MSTTSLKLPEDVKQLAIAAAKQRGITPHAFMVEAIRTVASAEERRAGFITEALEARAETIRSGKGYKASEAHEFLKRRVQGKKAVKPRAKSWHS
jgi:hypothetical protein